MKLMMVCIGLIVMLIAGLFAYQGKEGRGYKIVSKFLRPVIPQPELKNLLSTNYTEDFKLITESAEWQWYQPELIDWRLNGEALVLNTTQESVWWQNSRGPMLFRPVKGDVTVSISLKARKASNPELATDSAYQFGGIMLRDPAGEKLLTSENYVFNVVGNRGKNGIQVETKSTLNGSSSVQGTDWDSADVTLKIKRSGPTFSLFAKSQDKNDWQLVQEYQRPDLPEVLQLGVIVYSYSRGKGVVDLEVAFEDLLVNFE